MIKGDVQALQHLPEDVRDRLLLEDAALDVLGQQPELGYHFRLEADQDGVAVQSLHALPLAEPADDAGEVARRVVLEGDGDLLAQQLLKRHLARSLGVHPELEVEQLGNPLRAGEGVEQ